MRAPDPVAVTLTPRDYAILRGIALHRPLAPRGYYTLLHARLLSAEIVAAVDADVVTLDSTVRYRVGAGSVLEHQLVLGSFDALMGKRLSVRTLVGVAMLGARKADAIALPGPDAQQVVIEAVSQPPPAEPRPRLPGRQLQS
jgi:regulator of nucleoside diphosphate kinase